MTTTGLVTGGQDGIDVYHRGAGDVTINASNTAGTGEVYGATTGIRARNRNGGAISITGNEVRSYGNAIYANNDASGTGITITTDGTVAGNNNGIVTRNNGTGDTVINTSNATTPTRVTGQTSFGISATDKATAGALSITTNSVYGSSHGIFARGYGTGTTTVTATNSSGTASVTAYYNDGIDVVTTVGAVVVSANDVSGGTYGVTVDSASTASVTTTGIVSGRNEDGIRVRAVGGLTINATNTDGTAQVAGAQDGINANNVTGGATTVMADSVTGTMNFGITAINQADGGVLVSSTGAVTGGAIGINAVDYGLGDMTVTATNMAGTAMVMGNAQGILVNNQGGGALRLTADNATGTTLDGIYAVNDASGTTLSVTTTGTVMGGQDGIEARNNGSGDLTVNASNVAGTGQVTGAQTGIIADNNAGGALTVLANNVTGTAQGGINANNDSSGTTLSVTATGTVMGGNGGIYATNYGMGDLTVTAANASMTASVTGGTDGIAVLNLTYGAATVNANNVQGTSRSGIIASNFGQGGTTITATGMVTGGQQGIAGRDFGAGALTVRATNAMGTSQVTGGFTGIFAENQNGGALSVTAENVTGMTDEGINARNDISGTDLTVRTYGTIIGGDNGIEVDNGGVLGSATTVNATNSDGTGLVSGGDFGIFARSSLSSLSISANNVTGTNLDAINATTAGGATTQSITTTGTVIGGDNGIESDHDGSGDLIITTTNMLGTGSVTGARVGIFAVNENGGALSVSADNAYGGTGNAIEADNDRDGTTMLVSATGTVRSTTQDGIHARHFGSGDATIRSDNAADDASVTGNRTGIFAQNYGQGALSVTANNVTGTTRYGVYAYNYVGGTALDVTTYGTVYGDLGGIRAEHRGMGDISVTAANMDGTAATNSRNDAISVYHAYRGGVTVVADNATSTTGTGVRATNTIDGAFVSVETRGTIMAAGNGIFARSNSTGDLTVTASSTDGTAQVASTATGIAADNNRGGALSVTADNVTSTSGNGIDAKNDSSGSSLSVNSVGAISGNQSGILAVNRGNGALSIMANDATGTVRDGIYASNRSTGTSLFVAATGSVRGGLEGIQAENQGSGNLTVDASNTTGSAQVTGGAIGILAENENGGALSVTADNVTGTTGDGINARNDASGSTLDVTNRGVVTGGSDGIRAENLGSGDLTIDGTNATASGQVTGGTFGVFAQNFNGGALSVTADSVTGMGDDGIYAYGDATGTSVSVRSFGTVAGGDGPNEYGINARNTGTGDVMVNASNAAGTGQVTGSDTGIAASNRNGGALSVTADSVTGNNRDAILAYSDASGTTVSVTTYGDVTGGDDGIYAYNYGSGGLSITASNATGTATVTGQDLGIYGLNTNGGALTVVADTVMAINEDAITVANQAGTTSLSITAQRAYGGNIGIASTNRGTGDLTTEVGTATGGRTGIYARSYFGGAVTIEAQNATGTTYFGINAQSDATGTDMSITTTGTVNGQLAGINAINEGSGDLTIQATSAGTTAPALSSPTNRAAPGPGAHTYGATGIIARNTGGGLLSITAEHVSGTSENGVYALNDSYGTGLSVITTGTVTGALAGIYANHQGTGELRVTISGQTSGDTGINANTPASGMSVINVNNGADLSGTTYALLNGAGDSAVYFKDGATVSGVTSLGDGSDNLTIADADISGATTLDGGDDSDTADGFIDILSFSGFSGAFGTDLLNWEDVSFDSSTVSFTSDAIATPKIALENDTVFAPTQTDFRFNAELTIDPTSRFDAGVNGMGRVRVNGNVMNDGEIRLSNDVAGDRLTINGDLSGTGTIGLDVDISDNSADTVRITGDTNDQGGIDINGVGTGTAPEMIELVEVEGATSTNAFALSSANFTTPDGEDAQVIGAFTYTLTFDDDTGTFALTPFGDEGTMQSNPVVPVFEAYPSLLTALNTPGSTFQTWGNRTGNGGESVSQSLFSYEFIPQNAIWISFNGSTATLKGQNTTGAQIDTDGTRFEMGVDFPVFEGQSGRFILGASIALHDSRSDVTGPLSSGSVNTEGQSGTLSGLWLSDSQFYTQGQLRFSTFSTDMVLAGFGPVSLGSQGEGLAVSLEMGQAFAVSERLTLVPQLQFIHSDVRGDGIADPFGVAFAGTITDGDTTTARIGLHAERSTGRGSVFGAMSYVHALDNDTTVTFLGMPFTTSPDKHRIELRAGGQISVGANSQLFGGITFEGGLSDLGDDHSYALTGGLRVNF